MKPRCLIYMPKEYIYRPVKPNCNVIVTKKKLAFDAESKADREQNLHPARPSIFAESSTEFKSESDKNLNIKKKSAIWDAVSLEVYVHSTQLVIQNTKLFAQ